MPDCGAGQPHPAGIREDCKRTVLDQDSKPSFLRSLIAVLWSFAGIRKSSEHRKDIQSVKPEHVIIAGLLAAFIFVIGLIIIVNWVISSAARS